MIAEPPSSSLQGPSLRRRLVLIVDDFPENLQVLGGHLTAAGHEILAANSGPRALALINNRKPDLILLDIMMPVMDGLEVCRQLKADPETADIPVIFITARTETSDIVQGFELGAVDYVTKPFKPEELLARVNTHLDLKAARDMLATYNTQLLRLSRHLRRLNEDKNRFLAIVSHDIRGAFGNVVSVSRLALDAEAAPDRSELTELLSDIGVEAEHMIALAQNLLNVEALERRDLKLRRERVDTAALLEFATAAHQIAARAKGITFGTSSDGAAIAGDVTACRQILTNLVSNAVKYSPPGSLVEVGARLADGEVEITVRDEGPGLSEEDQERLFQPFVRLSAVAEAHEHSVGLGLSIVKLMAESMGGRVGCESAPGTGACFRVVLPAA